MAKLSAVTVMAMTRAKSWGDDWSALSAPQRESWRSSAREYIRELNRLGFTIVEKPVTKVRRRRPS